MNRITLTSLLLLSLLITNSKPIQPLSTPQSSQPDIWHTQTLASQGNLGAYSDIVVRQNDGVRFIAFYDASATALAIITDGAALSGDAECPAAPGWQCAYVDINGDVGRFASLTLHPINGTPAIAYYDATNQRLNVAEYQCTPECTWTITHVDTQSGYSAGLHAKAVYASDGTLHVAYQIASQSQPELLRHAWYVGTGGNCASSKWHCETILQGEGVAESLDFGIDDDDQLHIAYFEASNGDLAYATPADSPGIGNCPTNPDWDCHSVDSAGEVGLFPALDLHHGVKIAYYDSTNGYIKLAYQTYADYRNCGEAAFPMRCISVEDVGMGITVPGIAVGEAYDDVPLLAFYTNPGSGEGQLVFAEFVGLNGNCGPLFDMPWPYPDEYTWQCTTVDNGTNGAVSQDVGKYVSMALDRDGLPSLAYYNSTSGDLKHAYLATLAPVYLPFLSKGE